MKLYSLKSIVVLPVKGHLPCLGIKGVLPGHAWETEINIIEDIINKELTPLSSYLCNLDLSKCTVFLIKTFLQYQGNKESAKKYVSENSASIMSDNILYILNHFIMILKFQNPNIANTGVYRNFGDLDVILSNIQFENIPLNIRSNPSFWHSIKNLSIYPKNPTIFSDEVVSLDLSQKIPKEWAILTRSTDLINHGYYSESFLVAFALLDETVQSFVTKKLPNLTEEEASKLLRTIATSRMATYLGPLFKICFNESPLDTARYKQGLDFINTKRNAIIHNGEYCSRNDAIRGLNTILDFMKYLGDKGGNYLLPEELSLWSPIKNL